MARQTEATRKSTSSNGICAFFLRLIGRKKKPKNKSKQLLVTDVTVDDDDVISVKRTTTFERSKSSRWKSSWKRQSFRKSYREKRRLDDDDEKSVEVNHTSTNDESSKTSSADESLHQNEDRDSKFYKSEKTSNRYDVKRKSATLTSGGPRHAIGDRGGGAHFIRSSAGYVSFHAPKSYNYRPHFRPNSSLVTDGRTLPSNHHHQTLDQLQRCLSAGNVMQDSEEENLRDSVTTLRRKPFMSSNINNTIPTTVVPPSHKQSTIKCASSVIDLTSQSNAARKEELRRKLIELVNSAPSFQEKQQQRTVNQMLIKKRAPIVDNAETGNYVFLSPIEEITSQALHKSNQQSLSRSTPSVNMNGENPVRPNQQSQYPNFVQPSDNNAQRIRALQQQQAAAAVADSNNRSRSRTRNISRRFTQSGALSSSSLAQPISSHTYYSSTDDIKQLYADQMSYISPQPHHNNHRTTTATSTKSSNNDDYVYLTRAPPVGSAEPHIPPQGARHRASSRPKSCYDRFNHPLASTDDLSSSSPAESLNQKKRNRNVVRTSRSGDYYHLDVIVSKPKPSSRSGSRRRMSMSKRSERSDISVAGSDRTQIYYSLDV